MRPIFLSSSLFSLYRLFFEKKTYTRAKSFVTKTIQKEEFNFLLFYSPFSLGILLFEDLIVFNKEIFVSSRKHVHRIGLSLSSMISELRPIYIYKSIQYISSLVSGFTSVPESRIECTRKTRGAPFTRKPNQIKRIKEIYRNVVLHLRIMTCTLFPRPLSLRLINFQRRGEQNILFAEK